MDISCFCISIQFSCSSTIVFAGIKTLLQFNVTISIFQSVFLSQLRLSPGGILQVSKAVCLTCPGLLLPSFSSYHKANGSWWGGGKGGGMRRKGHILKELVLLQYGIWAFCYGKCSKCFSPVRFGNCPSPSHPPSPALDCFLTQAVQFWANIFLTLAIQLMPQWCSQRNSRWCNVLSWWLTPGYFPSSCHWLWEILPTKFFMGWPLPWQLLPTNQSPSNPSGPRLPNILPLCLERRPQFLQLHGNSAGYRDVLLCFWQADKHAILYKSWLS